MVKVLDEGLDAERCAGRTASGDPIIMPDHLIRLRTVEIALRLADLFPEKNRQHRTKKVPDPRVRDFMSLSAEERDKELRELAADLGYDLRPRDSEQ